jgi:hypothetical protein
MKIIGGVEVQLDNIKMILKSWTASGLGQGLVAGCCKQNNELLLLLLSLATQLSIGLGLLLKIRLNFLEASQHFLFYRVGLLAQRPTPSLGTRPLYLYPPEAGWLPILVAFYDTHGLR